MPFLCERLRPAEPIEARKLAQWVAGLDSGQFQLRQQATQELDKLDELAVPALNKVLADGPPLETRRRVEQLLEKASGHALTAGRRG